MHLVLPNLCEAVFKVCVSATDVIRDDQQRIGKEIEVSNVVRMSVRADDVGNVGTTETSLPQRCHAIATIANERVPIQLTQCWFPGPAISSAKI